MAGNTSLPDLSVDEGSSSSHITHPSSVPSSTLSSYDAGSDMDDKIIDVYDEDFVDETNMTMATTEFSDDAAWPYTWDIFRLGVFYIYLGL